MKSAPTRPASSGARRRKIIVHIATSADGYIARPDGDIEWLTSRPAPKGFYGIAAFMRSIDTEVLGRKTYDAALALGGKFDAKTRHVVFSRQAPPADAPKGVEFTSEPIGPFVSRLRESPGKDIRLAWYSCTTSCVGQMPDTIRRIRRATWQQARAPGGSRWTATVGLGGCSSSVSPR